MDVDLKILIIEKQIDEIYSNRPVNSYGQDLPMPDCFILKIAELTGELKALKEYKKITKEKEEDKEKNKSEFCDLYYGISEF